MRKFIIFLIIGAAISIALLVVAAPYIYRRGQEFASKMQRAISETQAQIPRHSQAKKADGLVTIKPPYDDIKWGHDDPEPRISVQNAAYEVVTQAGLKYNWKESYANTKPICQRWTYPDFENKPWEDALEDILSPHGLTYVQVQGEILLLKKDELPKWEEEQRRLAEDLAFLTSPDFVPERLHDAVLIFPLLDREGKTTGPGTILAELGMLKATYSPHKTFDLHVPSVIDRYQSSGYMESGKTFSVEEREAIVKEFRAKSFATGTLDLSPDNTFRAELLFEGERGKKSFSTGGPYEELNNLPYWIAQCLYTYCDVPVNSEIKETLETSELRYPDAVFSLAELESEFQKSGNLSSGWDNLLRHNPDSVFILYRCLPFEQKEVSSQIEGALRVSEDHDFLLFLEAESYQQEKDYEDSLYQYVSLLKKDVRNETLYSRVAEALDELGRNEDAIALYDFWKAHNPDSYLVYLREGTFYVDYAWDARGSGYAYTVTENGWKLFRERLHIAEKILNHAYELNPDDPAIATEMISVAIGLHYSREEMEEWFEKAVAADPTYYAAYKRKLHYLKPIWYGSRDEMLEFARECAANPPENSQVAFILLDAHEFLSKHAEESGNKRESYFANPEVWNELKPVFEEYLSKHPDSMWARNSFAKYACYAKDYEEASRQFDIIRDNCDEGVWGSNREFQQYKTLAYSNGNEPPEKTTSGDNQTNKTRYRFDDNRKVSLKPPFTGWNPNKRDPEDQIAVIDAVDAICRQAGIPHDYEKSYDNIKPLCNQRISPVIEKRPWKEAMATILDPLELSYTFEHGKAVLTRK